MVRAALLGVVVMVMAFGCNRPSTPEQAYLSFVEALDRQDEQAAFRALSERAQAELRRRADEVAKASGGSVKADAPALAFSLTGRPSGVSQVTVVSLEGDRAMVEVVVAGKSERVPLVREQGSWKIDPPMSK